MRLRRSVGARLSVVAAFTEIVDLGQLGLKPGGGFRFDAEVPIGDFVFGDQRYRLRKDPAPATIDANRTSTGYVVRLRAENLLDGPCMRCYGDYSLPLRIDHSEVHEPQLGEDLTSEYVTANDLDLAGLLRDAIGLELPTSISSPVDAAGACTECENAQEQRDRMTDSPAQIDDHEPDPRWAKLRELDL